MKQKSLFFKGLLLFTMAFGMMSCGDDDKKDEIVDDPLQTQSEYYIVGTVMGSNDVITGAKAEVEGASATTDSNGAYSLTVEKTGTYTVKFSADGMENLEGQVTIAIDAANRTQVALNVKLAKAIDMTKAASADVKENEDTSIEVPNQETSEAEAAINVPSGAADAGTTISAVAYEEAQVSHAEETTTAQQEKAAAISNVAIQTEPADATANEDIEITIDNAADDSYFDIDYMESLKDEAMTKAAVPFGKVAFKDNKYVVTIPKGEKIAGKYSTNVKYGKKAENVKAGDYNRINNQNGVLKIENRDYNAQNVTLDVETTCGWQYATSPEEALGAAGASTTLAATIKKYIESNEGKEGTYTVKKTLNASISGNHVLFFGSKAKTQEKNYTFNIVVNGQKKTITVKVTAYVGYTEEYTNGPISQHSGGGNM